MSNLKTFTTSPLNISASSFYPRNYNPEYLYVKNTLQNCETLSSFLKEPVKGGSTPPAHFFYEENGIPFIKTSAILRHFVNANDLYYINEKYHRTSLKRSITNPYDVIFSMTGKFMGKATLCPKTIPELNMSQNSVLLRTDSPLKSAFLAIYLNSEINQIQIKGLYSITKQKFLNQGKITNLKISPYKTEYESILKQYLDGFDEYYEAVKEIQTIILEFNKDNGLDWVQNNVYSCTVSPIHFDAKILTPNAYRQDTNTIISKLTSGKFEQLETNNLRKGDEIGSENYLESGVPFIKTSDICNFDIDKTPNYYCSSSFHQDIKRGDIIFTKDGKPGEIAIINEDATAVLSSGLVIYHPQNEQERYWLFLLLSSNYGMAYFKKWFVIASTMNHLRKDFYDDFKIPECTDEFNQKYVSRLKAMFEKKNIGFEKMQESITTITSKLIS